LRVPIRLRGVATGLAILTIAPAVALGTGHGRPSATPVRPGAGVALAGDVELVARFLPVRDPQGLRDDATPAPTVAPAPTATPRPRTAAWHLAIPNIPRPTPGTIEAILQAAATRWGVSYALLFKIAACESGLRPNAYNPSGPYYGLFQFLLSTFKSNGGTSIWDPVDQANIAAKMISRGQVHEWACA